MEKLRLQVNKKRQEEIDKEESAANWRRLLWDFIAAIRPWGAQVPTEETRHALAVANYRDKSLSDSSHHWSSSLQLSKPADLCTLIPWEYSPPFGGIVGNVLQWNQFNWSSQLFASYCDNTIHVWYEEFYRKRDRNNLVEVRFWWEQPVACQGNASSRCSTAWENAYCGLLSFFLFKCDYRTCATV